jgi:hypothetical protein
MIQRMYGLFAAVALLLSAGCHAQTPSAVAPPDWKTECVGRYQVSVPGEVEVALDSYKHLFDENDPNQYRFGDDTIAHYSHHDTVYPLMDSNEAIEFMHTIKKNFDKNVAERYQEAQITIDTKSAYWMSFADDVNKKDFAWVEGASYSLFIYRDGHFFNFGDNLEKSDNPAKDTERSIAAMRSTIKSFHPRALFELPKSPGVCFPYGFIADDGKASRDIAVTMRLKDHPDVEVFFQDKSGYLSGGTLHEPKDDIEYFWTMMYRDFAKLLEADFQGYHPVKMGGQDGTALFVTITRKDGSKDFGYAAIVKGDPKAATDTPSQMLYVIRTAARAKGKPVSRDELKDMARQIAASIKRHDVQ